LHCFVLFDIVLGIAVVHVVDAVVDLRRVQIPPACEEDSDPTGWRPASRRLLIPVRPVSPGGVSGVY
jgi:hypothetical protein